MRTKLSSEKAWEKRRWMQRVREDIARRIEEKKKDGK
jgi:hypothetical protein